MRRLLFGPRPLGFHFRVVVAELPDGVLAIQSVPRTVRGSTRTVTVTRVARVPISG